jgi:hypothetical protein
VKNNIEINGIYRFYQDGQLIGEHSNALTVAGRSIAIKSLLGIIPNFANSISYGIGASANVLNSASTLITNNVLNFEIGRIPVTGGTLELQGTNDALIFTGEITEPEQFRIYEVGLFPSGTVNESISVEGSTIFNFDQVDSFAKYGTASASGLENSASARIGTQMFKLNSGNASSNYIEFVSSQNYFSSLNGYSSEDLFKTALYNTTNSVASVSMRFYTDSSNYYTLNTTTPASAGYHIVQTKKGDAVVTGTPDWGSTTAVRIYNLSSQDVMLDALKIDVGSYSLDTNLGMISRAVLPSPIVKQSSIPLTIQYSLIINFSGGV